MSCVGDRPRKTKAENWKLDLKKYINFNSCVLHFRRVNSLKPFGKVVETSIDCPFKKLNCERK